MALLCRLRTGASLPVPAAHKMQGMPSAHSILSVFAPSIAADLRSAPAASRRLGFQGLQLPVRYGSVDLATLSGTGFREVRHILATQEQTLTALATDLGPKGFSPGADIDQALSRLAKAVDAARGLGVGVITIDLGPLPQPKAAPKPAPKVTPAMAGLIILPGADILSAPANPSPPETTDPSFFSQVDAALIELGRLADRASVVLALRSDLSSFAALERALRAVDCPWFGLDLDPVAILRDEWQPDEIFSRLGMLVRHVRARDAVSGAGGRTRPAAIGQGNTDWPELLARLDEAAYHGPITVDATELPDRPAGTVAAVKVLRASR
jgi:sugar phosphate isomerase/epimerase